MKIKNVVMLTSAVAFLAASNAQAYFDPSTGRWASRDPIAERGGFNLYSFAENDAIDHPDYLGLDVGTVSVDENQPYGILTRGWKIKLTWTPPDSWKKQSPTCLACQSAVWVQDKNYYIKYPW